MLQNLTGVHLVVILAIVLLLFGAPKLPGLAKSLGQSMRILKKEVGATVDDGADATDTDTGGSIATNTATNVATSAPAPGANGTVADSDHPR